jgi:hypothetical protein
MNTWMDFWVFFFGETDMKGFVVNISWEPTGVTIQCETILSSTISILSRDNLFIESQL